MIQSMDQKGLDFLIGEEGLKLKPYLDSVGVPTIGVGCTYYEDGKRVKMTDKSITRGRAIELFKYILQGFERSVRSLVTANVSQNQFNALVSIAYNIGVPGFKKSTLLRLVNANPADPKIRAAFEMWKNAGGKPVLLPRRGREAQLYFEQ